MQIHAKTGCIGGVRNGLGLQEQDACFMNERSMCDSIPGGTSAATLATAILELYVLVCGSNEEYGRRMDSGMSLVARSATKSKHGAVGVRLRPQSCVEDHNCCHGRTRLLRLWRVPGRFGSAYWERHTVTTGAIVLCCLARGMHFV